MSNYGVKVICPLSGRQCVNDEKPSDDDRELIMDEMGNTYDENECAFTDDIAGVCNVSYLLDKLSWLVDEIRNGDCSISVRIDGGGVGIGGSVIALKE